MITANLNATIGKMMAGDILIFQYAGHGCPVDDPGDPNDPAAVCPGGPAIAHADEDIGPGGTGLSDDQLTTILSKVPAKATAYAILDACFSGLAVADATDLASLPIDFTGTADKNNCAPGTSSFLLLFVSAFQVQNGFFKADTGKTGSLTEADLVTYTQTFLGPAYAPCMIKANCISDRNSQNLIIATTPEPSLFAVLGAALVCLAFARRRKQAPAD